MIIVFSRPTDRLVSYCPWLYYYQCSVLNRRQKVQKSLKKKGSRRYKTVQKDPRRSKKVEKVTKRSEKFQRGAKYSKKVRKGPKGSQKVQKVQKGPKRSQKDSKRFKNVPKNIFDGDATHCEMQAACFFICLKLMELNRNFHPAAIVDVSLLEIEGV